MSNMIQNMVFDKSGVPLLRRFLNLSSLRQKLISGNIANVSTPGYQSKDIDFHGELNKAVKNNDGLKGVSTHPGHLPIGKSSLSGPEVIVDKTGESNGINNVNIDKEIADQAQNQIYYSIGARLLSLKFQGLKKVIQSK
jgi:flagellar basal-body rod protein FlgB